MAETVNSLWVGSPLDSNQKLTVKSYIANGHPFRLWMYDEGLHWSVPDGVEIRDAREIYPESEIFQLGEGDHKGSYAFFADQFMLRLLSERGGWWTGMDVTCLKPLTDFEGRDYLFAPHCTSGVGTHLIRSPANGQILKDCLSRFRDVFGIDNYDYHAGLRLIHEEVLRAGRSDAIGRAEHFGDDTPPYGLYYSAGAGTPPDELYVWHTCHSMTTHQENFIVDGSFYQKVLKKYQILCNH